MIRVKEILRRWSQSRKGKVDGTLSCLSYVYFALEHNLPKFPTLHLLILDIESHLGSFGVIESVSVVIKIS